MMDHCDLPKGRRFPDVDKDEPILDRYILKGPPTGQILGSFNTFQLGLLWKVPNVGETDMLKDVKPNPFIEEKVYFEKDFGKDEKVSVPMKIALFKSLKSSDLHLRAVYAPQQDDVSDDEPGVLSFLRSKHQLLGASIVNDKGKVLVPEKLSRSYMCIGQRNWDITSILTATDFEKGGLLSSDGSLILRITFGNKREQPANHYLGIDVPATVDDVANNDVQDCKEQAGLNLSTIGLDDLRFQLTNFSKARKFTDGILHVYDKECDSNVDFPVHRVVLAAKSPYFESQFELSPRVTIDNYSVQCVHSIIDYVYSGQIKNEGFNLLVQLIQAAEEYSIVGLKSRCLNGLIDCSIDVPQAMETFKLGQKENSVVLRVHATEYLNKLKGQLEPYETEFKAFMAETGTEVLFDWLLRKN